MMKRLLVVIIAALMLAGAVNLSHAQKFQADSNVNVTSILIANNTTAVVISATSATVYSIDASNNNGAVAYLKLYNAATATCGSGTPQARYTIPASVSGANISLVNTNGDSYVNGIVACITTGLADNNTGAPAAASGAVNIHWKQGQK